MICSLKDILDVLPNERTLTLTREGNWTREKSFVTIFAVFPQERVGTCDMLLSAWSSCKIHPSDHKHLGQAKHGALYRQGQDKKNPDVHKSGELLKQGLQT